MPTQFTASSVLSTEAVSALRRKVRIPLHDIISYVEIIAEETEDGKGGPISTHLAMIIAACESVLRVTAGFQIAGADLEGAVQGFRDQLLEHSGRILSLVEELQQCAPADNLQTDIGKLHAAAKAFQSLESTINSKEVLTPAESQPRRPGTSANERGSADGTRPKAGQLFGGSNQQLIRGGLVLVVDDDEGNRDVLSRRLLRDGCEVMLAETGRQALRMLRRYGFDLVLLDIMMPEMDGMTVLSELKQDPALHDLPVIMISAVDEIESVVRSIELGADDYLPKPFNPVILRARVNALLERKRLLDNEKRRTTELERAVAEIEQQRKKTEELLLNILPASVAHELRTQGSVQPMYFEDVTIAFADFAGFTSSTEQLPADELVVILHTYFTAFDNIIRDHGLEKLKTIGDCYMFAGGLPLRSPSHPVDAILAAFEMIHATQKLAKTGPVDWQLRIGVHTGPVIAGVVGVHKFAYDIWGDAVNLSSRMESGGAPGRINLSPNTYSRVKDFFACEKRGRLRIKDGREIEMYFVNGIAPGLLAAENHGAPNKSFSQRYRAYFQRDLRGIPECLLHRSDTP